MNHDFKPYLTLQAAEIVALKQNTAKKIQPFLKKTSKSKKEALNESATRQHP